VAGKEKRSANRQLAEKPEEKRPLERTNRTWEDNSKMYLKDRM
jgi:hypothetical protein